MTWEKNVEGNYTKILKIPSAISSPGFENVLFRDFCCCMVCYEKVHKQSIKRHVERLHKQISRPNVVQLVVSLSHYFSKEVRGKKYVCAVQDCLKTTSRKNDHQCHSKDLVLVKKRSDLPLDISNLIFPPPLDGESL